MLVSVLSNDPKSHIALHFNHLDLRNANGAIDNANDIRRC